MELELTRVILSYFYKDLLALYIWLSWPNKQELRGDNVKDLSIHSKGNGPEIQRLGIALVKCTDLPFSGPKVVKERYTHSLLFPRESLFTFQSEGLSLSLWGKEKHMCQQLLKAPASWCQSLPWGWECTWRVTPGRGLEGKVGDWDAESTVASLIQTWSSSSWSKASMCNWSPPPHPHTAHLSHPHWLLDWKILQFSETEMSPMSWNIQMTYGLP